MSKAVVGLNIGNQNIKAVELRKTGKGIQVSALGMYPTPEGAVGGGEIMAPDLIAQALKDLFHDAGIKCKNVVASLSGQGAVVVRVAEVPKMSKKELHNMVGFEIERQVPFQSDEIIKSYVLLKDLVEVGEGENVPVLYAAARMQAVNTLYEALSQAGLNAVAFDVEPIAAARGVVNVRKELPSDAECIAIVNIGAEYTDIVLVQGILPVFPRIVPTGGNQFTNAISDTLGLDRKEAERVKIEMGTAWLGDGSFAPPQVSPADQDIFSPAPPTMPVGGAPPTIPAPQPSPAPAELDFSLPSAGSTPPTAETSPAGEPFTLDSLPGLEETPPSEPQGGSSGAESEEGGTGGMEVAEIDFGLPELEQEPPPPKPTPPAGEFDFMPTQPPPPTPAAAGVPAAPGMEEHTPMSSHYEGMGTEDFMSDSFSIGGTSYADPRSVYDVIEPQLHELAQEIARSVEYYTAKSPGVQLAKVYLIGGGAKLRDLDKFLHAQIGVPVEVANSFQHLDASPLASRLSDEELREMAPYFVVAIGLAMREFV